MMVVVVARPTNCEDGHDIDALRERVRLDSRASQPAKAPDQRVASCTSSLIVPSEVLSF